MKGKNLMLMFIVFIAVAFMVPSTAHANVILPTFILLPMALATMYPLLLAAFVFVTIIESVILCSVLGLSLWYSVWVSFAANLVSTVVGVFGVPIIIVASFILWPILFFIPDILLYIFRLPYLGILLLIISVIPLLVELITYVVNRDSKYKNRWLKRLGALFRALLFVSDDDGWEDWMGPAVILFCLIPCFFASWYIEGFIAKIILQSYEIAPELVEYSQLIANLVSYGIIALIVALWLVMELLGVTWKNLIGTRQEFESEQYGYKTDSVKPSVIRSTYELVEAGKTVGMYALEEADAEGNTIHESFAEEQLQGKETVKDRSPPLKGECFCSVDNCFERKTSIYKPK